MVLERWLFWINSDLLKLDHGKREENAGTKGH